MSPSDPTWQIPRNHSTSMTDASAYTDPAAESGDASGTWTTWGLISKHKIAAGVGMVLLLLLLVIVVGGLVSAKPVVVSDATTCTSWGATKPDPAAGLRAPSRPGARATA